MMLVRVFFEIHPRLKASFNSIAAKPRTFEDRDQKIILNLCLLAGVAMEELVTLAGMAWESEP